MGIKETFSDVKGYLTGKETEIEEYFSANGIADISVRFEYDKEYGIQKIIITKYKIFGDNEIKEVIKLVETEYKCYKFERRLEGYVIEITIYNN